MNYAKIVIPILVLFISNAYAVSLQSRCEQLFTDALKEQLSPQDQMLVVEVANSIGGKEKNRLLDEVLKQNPPLEILSKIVSSIVEIDEKSRIRILEKIIDKIIVLQESEKDISPQIMRLIEGVAFAVGKVGEKSGIRILEKIIDKLRVLQELEKDISPQIMRLIEGVAFAVGKVGEKSGIRILEKIIDKLVVFQESEKDISPQIMHLLKKITSSAVKIGGNLGIHILEKIIDKLVVHQESEKNMPYQVMQLISDVAFAAIKIGGEPGSHFFKNLSSILLPEVQKKMLRYIISGQISSLSQIEYLLKQDSLSHLRLDIIDSVIYRTVESGLRDGFVKELLENDTSPEVRRIIIGYIAPSTGIITGMVSYRNAFIYLKNLLQMNLSSQTIETIAQFVNESPRKRAMVQVINDLERQASYYISEEVLADLKRLKSLLDKDKPPKSPIKKSLKNLFYKAN